jgi:DNA-binding FadR family transcriptional regulator
MTSTSAARDEPARARKLGEKIAERIIANIVERGWPVGENLGTERALLAHYKTARATFREAIRQVERHGAAHMRRGAGGGLIVAEPPRAAAARAMLSYLELTQVSFAEQHEVREQLEAVAARLAAERIDEAEGAKLTALVKEVKKSQTDFVANVAANMRVRVAVGEATGNPVIPLFIEVLNGVLREILRVLRGDEESFQRDRQLSGDFKQQLVSAILRHDADAAERLVHEDAHRRVLAMTWAVTRPPAPAPAGYDLNAQLPAWWETEQLPLKLSDQIVYRIVNDIAKLGWKEGHNLGKEIDLQQTYSVSRAVLREAIRQLELHGIARMKTGLQGGLVISRIDPAYTVELVTTYLKSAPFDVMHLWEAQSALEVFAVGQLARVADDADCAALTAVMARVRVASLEDYLATANEFHEEIGDRVRNRALSLFVRVLSRFVAEVCPPATEQVRPWLVDMHQRILDAICARDHEAARREMARLYTRVGVWMTRRKK